jgi:hypothetical protein
MNNPKWCPVTYFSTDRKKKTPLPTNHLLSRACILARKRICSAVDLQRPPLPDPLFRLSGVMSQLPFQHAVALYETVPHSSVEQSRLHILTTISCHIYVSSSEALPKTYALHMATALFAEMLENLLNANSGN